MSRVVFLAALVLTLSLTLANAPCNAFSTPHSFRYRSLALCASHSFGSFAPAGLSRSLALAMLKLSAFLNAHVALGWPVEPGVPRGAKGMHTTLFSAIAVKDTAWYKAMGDPPTPAGPLAEAYTQEINKLVSRKIKVLNSEFYNDPNFSNIKCVLRDFADWCDQHNGGVYSIDRADIIVDFLEYSLDQKRAAEPGVSPKTLFNWLRKAIPTLERVAGWQGYTELARGKLPRAAAMRVTTVGSQQHC